MNAYLTQAFGVTFGEVGYRLQPPTGDCLYINVHA